MRRTMQVMVICAASVVAPRAMAEGRTGANHEAKACLLSRGSWDENQSPSCLCQKPRVNWRSEGVKRQTPEAPVEDICVTPGHEPRRTAPVAQAAPPPPVVIAKVVAAPKQGKVSADAPCRQTCQAFGNQANWQPSAAKGLRCKPIDIGNYLPDDCRIVPMPPPAPDPTETCRLACGSSGGFWAQNQPEGVRCQPPSDKFQAGPCGLVPIRSEIDPLMVVMDLCRGSGGDWQRDHCRCPAGEHTEPGSSVCVANEKRSSWPVHIGAELYAAGFAARSVQAPLGAGPGLRLWFGLTSDERLALLVHGGLFVNGASGVAAGTPLGIYGGLDVWRRFSGSQHFGFAVGGHVHDVAVDHFGSASATEFGAHVVPLLLRGDAPWGGRCSGGLGIGGGYVIPDEALGLTYFVGFGCETQ